MFFRLMGVLQARNNVRVLYGNFDMMPGLQTDEVPT